MPFGCSPPCANVVLYGLLGAALSLARRRFGFAQPFAPALFAAAVEFEVNVYSLGFTF